MCGIAGIVNLKGAEISQVNLRQMSDAAFHRGPDADGFYAQGVVGFAHRRLAIIDLSPGGAQPMHGPNGTVITFNGEIYNYLEIREELCALGYVFNSESDTEVILAAYQAWDVDCVNHFNGMWAFAIHDPIKNRVFLSRDRFGVKPLYYYSDGTDFFFASEIKQLLPFRPKGYNKEILLNYLVYGLEEYSQDSFFAGIVKLLPAHNLLIDLTNGAVSTSVYYELKYNANYAALKETEAIELFQKEFERSIRYRLRSDVQVGTCLSGGLDSSAIAAVASKQFKPKNKGQRFTAITAQSIDKIKDETPFAKQVADHSNLDWHITKPDRQDFLDHLNTVIRVQEEPFGSPSIVFQYFVFKKAKELGCIVMLDGQGGDEVLMGYERYYASFLASFSLPNRLLAAREVAEHSKLSWLQAILYTWYFRIPFLRIRKGLKGWRGLSASNRKLLRDDLIVKMAETNANAFQLQQFEITKMQLPHLLKYEDRNSMHFSIESRLPFLDYRLVELGVSLSAQCKMKEGWTKYILRKAMKGLVPESVLWRTNKFGFEAPVVSWLDRQEMLDAIKSSSILLELGLQSDVTAATDLKVLWRLFNVACWELEFKAHL
jgi:asparagine synthase (glutamine-hydrolysing)